MKIRKTYARHLALLLALIMAFGLIAPQAFADNLAQAGDLVINKVYAGDTTVSGTAKEKTVDVTVDFPNGSSETASVASDGTWSVTVPSGVTLAAGDTISAEQRADVVLDIDANVANVSDPSISYAKPGNTLQYTYTVKNDGHELSVWDVLIEFKIPNYMEFQADTVMIDGTAAEYSFDYDSRKGVWVLTVSAGLLARGEEASVAFKVEVKGDANINNLEMTATFGDGGGSSNYYANVSTTVLSDKVTVTYTANGGSGETVTENGVSIREAYSVKSGDSAGFSRSGYTFTGWNTTADGTGDEYEAGKGYYLTGDLTLYAQWKRNSTDPITPTDPADPTDPTDPADPTDPVDPGDDDNGTTSDGHEIGGGSGRDPSNPNDTIVIIGEDETPLGSLESSSHIKYLNGYPDGSVRPEGNITRAEVAAIFYRLLSDDNKTADTAQAFSDVAADAWYSQYVNYLASLGIVNGYEGGTFRPDEPITRAEFATIVSRFDNLILTTGTAFVDVAEDYWAVPYINSNYIKSWIDGYEDYSFKPEQSITRAEAVKIVNTMLTRNPATIGDNNPYNDIASSHWAYIHILEASIVHGYTRDDNSTEVWVTAE